ncbi:unnamed protein product [Rotaria socialis]
MSNYSLAPSYNGMISNMSNIGLSNLPILHNRSMVDSNLLLSNQSLALSLSKQGNVHKRSSNHDKLRSNRDARLSKIGAPRSKIDTRRSDTNAALSRLNKLLSNIDEINESTLKRRRSPLRLNETSANTHIDSDSEDVVDDRVRQSPTMINEENVYSQHSQHKKHKKHDQNHEEKKAEEESESELFVDCSSGEDRTNGVGMFRKIFERFNRFWRWDNNFPNDHSKVLGRKLEDFWQEPNHRGTSSQDCSELLKVLNECQIEVLNLHNALRAKHGVPHLILDNTLSQEAQRVAVNSANTAQNQQRTYEYKQGENVYTKSNVTSIQHISIGATATQCWYGEIKDYNFNIPIFSMSTCHFTQVVWKNTTRLGVGIAFDNEGKTAFVVALYDPAGNVKEKFFQNVLPPC